MDKAQYIEEIAGLLEECNGETVASINMFSKILVTLSAAQLEYLIELATLLFCQPPK